MKRASVKFLVLGAAGLLSGCLSRAPAHSAIAAASLPNGTNIPAAWTADRGASDAVTDNWLASFRNLQLTALVAEAIANNRDLSQAAARVEMARQSVVVVSSQLKPQIGLGLIGRTLRDAAQSSNDNSGQAVLGISWEADIWGKLRAQRASAKAGYQATALDYAWARQSLAATAAKSWYQAVTLRRLTVVQEEAVKSYDELLRLAKVKRNAGQVSDLDVAEASASAAEARDQLQHLEGLFQETRRDLEVLLGRYPAAAVDISRDFDPLPPPVPAGIPSSLLERRPDIAAAGQEVLAAFRTEEAAKLALLPSFTFGFDGGRLSDTLLSILRLNPWYYQTAIGMNLPIYTGGRLTAQVKIATAGQQAAVAHYGGVSLNAFREVENALTNETVYAQQSRYLDGALTDRTEAVRVATIRYKAGASDLLQVLQLQTYQLATQTQVIQMRNTQFANRVDLHLALGGSFDAAPAVTAFH